MIVSIKVGSYYAWVSPQSKRPEPSQSEALAKRITAVGTTQNDSVDKFYYKLREMAINNKSYLTKAFIFLFSLITEIYNNCIKQTFEKSVNNCNFVCQQTKLGDTEIILKKVDKVCQSSHTLSFVENIVQLYTHKPLKKKKIKNNSTIVLMNIPAPLK